MVIIIDSCLGYKNIKNSYYILLKCHLIFYRVRKSFEPDL